MTFYQYTEGVDPDAAFRIAREKAVHEYGPGGYSGTIAEKDSYVIVTSRLLTKREASQLAGDLIDRDDPRFIDKWGPAGAIPIKGKSRTIEVAGLPQPGRGTTLQGDELDAVIQTARRRRQLTADDIVTAAGWSWPAGQGTPATGSAWLTAQPNPAVLAAQTLPDGWLFFGWASH
ncbi:hypothetical protein ACQP2X_39575 [Actinoplanes sp. CA-131856]